MFIQIYVHHFFSSMFYWQPFVSATFFGQRWTCRKFYRSICLWQCMPLKLQRKATTAACLKLSFGCPEMAFHAKNLANRLEGYLLRFCWFETEESRSNGIGPGCRMMLSCRLLFVWSVTKTQREFVRMIQAVVVLVFVVNFHISSGYYFLFN